VKTNPRHDQIVALVDEHSFLTVRDLSRQCNVSEMTIRRDLEKLDANQRLKRTYGGAVSLRSESVENGTHPANPPESETDALLLGQVDVLIATSVDPYYDSLLIDRAAKENIPIIAESTEMPNQRTLVSIDNYQAGFDIGSWAGEYLTQRGIQKASLLDLTFHQANTLERSRGFVDGLKTTCPAYEVVLSIDSQSRYSTTYQLVQDALTVYPHINLMFAINDITAWGAINACRDLEIDPEDMTVITFGLEGETLINELMAAGSYCKAGLAMFPEIVGQICIDAAIAAYNQQPQPANYITPHVVLTPATLPAYYRKTASRWELNWDTARDHLQIPIRIPREKTRPHANLPEQIGLIVPFTEHEWYKNLTSLLQEYAAQDGIVLQIIDAERNVRDEVELRRRQIAHQAANLVKTGEVVLVDGGPIAVYLAEELKHKKEITVITNSVEVFDTLNHTPGIILISTGGTVRYSTQMLVGPTAEGALKELRADKLFLMVSGITISFGLSHHTISEVTMKQAMIKAAREVILLADHTAFGAEVGVQVAPLHAVQRLITDDALPATLRLEILQAGIQIISA
jgi:DeoR/GlpR family transcriptional regulator of sugar metabolism/ABC-type sugar transport system substrate-binding protein